MFELSQAAYWLPLLLLGVLYLALFLYVVLDGFDLGVGMLFAVAADPLQRQQMLQAIGPYWDANETWLVLAIVLLLACFPRAHGTLLNALYLPVTVMLFGLLLRGAAFDFHAKSPVSSRRWWALAFCSGSLVAALAQGLMLGRYVTGFQPYSWAWLFALGVALALPAGYVLLGACWLLLKGQGALRLRAILWARRALRVTVVGLAAVALASACCLPGVWAKWWRFSGLLMVVPVSTLGVWLWIERTLCRLSRGAESVSHASVTGGADWGPFAGAVAIFALGFAGLAYSVFPFLLVGQLDVWQAAASPDALRMVLLGLSAVLPCILGYTVYAHWVFRGKLSAVQSRDASD